MFCPFCGHQNREGKKFCRQCGRTMPPPRSSVGTTPLSHYQTFAEELNLLENPTPPNNTPPISLIDQSIYSSFSESIDKSAKVPSAAKWQPDIATKTSEGFAASSEIEQTLDQFTHQLLPDTVGFEVPKSPSSISVYSKSTPTSLNSNISNMSSSVGSFSQAKLESLNTSVANVAKKSSNGSLANPIVDFSDYGDPEFNTTEEMEALSDRGIEKTADIPVLTERTADMPVLMEKTEDIPILPERSINAVSTAKPINSAPGVVASILPIANTVKPQVNTSFSKSTETIGTIRTISNVTPSHSTTGVLSINSPTGNLVENTKRIEQIILIIIVFIALIGIGILVWILVLRPLGIAYLPINSFGNLFA